MLYLCVIVFAGIDHQDSQQSGAPLLLLSLAEDVPNVAVDVGSAVLPLGQEGGPPAP